MTPIRAAFICSKACNIIAEDAFSVASQHSSILFLRSAGMTSTQRAMFVDFPTEIGRSQNSHFLFLNIARRPHTTQSDLIFLNLSQASCMFGRVDIKWVTFMRAGGRYVNSNLFHEKSPLAWQSFCADTSPKLEVSTPCPKTKRTREDAVL